MDGVEVIRNWWIGRVIYSIALSSDWAAQKGTSGSLGCVDYTRLGQVDSHHGCG